MFFIRAIRGNARALCDEAYRLGSIQPVNVLSMLAKNVIHRCELARKAMAQWIGLTNQLIDLQ